MTALNETEIYQWLKGIDPLRKFVWKLQGLRRELGWTVDAVNSGRFIAYRKNYASSSQICDQANLTFSVDLPLLKDYHSLIRWLTEQSLEYMEGACCLYIPPQPRLRDAFSQILAIYPKHVGLKILKDINSPAIAKYVSKAVAPNAGNLEAFTSCLPVEFLRVANYLYSKGVGPRVYDLIEIQTPHNKLSAYVVQHVSGSIPSEEQCQAFMEKLEELFKHQLLALPNWKDKEDFQCPGCKGNLLHDPDSGSTLYVDFQSFMLKDNIMYLEQLAEEVSQEVHFGDAHWLRGGRYLYQSIPGLQIGQRDVGARWKLFKKLFADAGISLQDKVVFDIGCNMGMISYSALVDGARWVVGWDRPKVAQHTTKILLALGLTRFNIVSQEINPDTKFHLSLPENIDSNAPTILFYLAMRKHIGFPDGVNQLPFQTMVYEGHEDETLEDTKNYLQEILSKWKLKTVCMTTYRDGDSKARSLAILRRQ